MRVHSDEDDEFVDAEEDDFDEEVLPLWITMMKKSIRF